MQSSISKLFDLKHKVAVVTGGAMGIGAQVAERLGQAGAVVAVADLDIERARGVAERIRASGSIGKAFTCDVSRLPDIRRLVDTVAEAFGRLDILVNNAGIFPQSPALEVSEATWDKVQAVNLKGAFFLAQAAAQQMIKQGDGGSIVNIASIDALHPMGRLVPYDTSKAGLVMMTRSLAFELGARRIRVNAIAPGVIQTPGADAALTIMAESGSVGRLKAQLVSHVPLGRLGTPDDIARAVLFFVSPAADYVTGSTLVVDGGFLLG